MIFSRLVPYACPEPVLASHDVFVRNRPLRKNSGVFSAPSTSPRNVLFLTVTLLISIGPSIQFSRPVISMLLPPCAQVFCSMMLLLDLVRPRLHVVWWKLLFRITAPVAAQHSNGYAHAPSSSSRKNRNGLLFKKRNGLEA
jgi:hypothetical protein